ncbi:hypothetical protein [Curtanaerobium respiraculi]|uniref:hypothetical protein n=1 Tax=Curtanaerobium respiraculi TaxID=2949669 RepID=UPI0024B36473|nr:hypothetical protein [Curtanaerobium respiraculi]
MRSTMEGATRSLDTADMLKARSRSSFFRKGVTLAVLSGIMYGLYTGFITLAEGQGIWGAWFGGQAALSAFAVTFILASLASGINDLLSGVWSLIFAAVHGELGDFARTCASKPGRVMMLCAIVGGPGGATLYVVALNMATAAGAPGIIVPVAALNVAVGAVLSRFFFKQELNARMVAGIAICLACCGVIGGTSFGNVGTQALVACLFAFGAAICWGFEGCVAGYGTALIDFNVGITIRQITSGLVTLLVLVPVLCCVDGGGMGLYGQLLEGALSDPSTALLLVSGFFAMYAYSLWYKGNSMCGTALGMACNGMYSFWGPLFIWVINGALNLGGAAEAYPPLMPVQWIAAAVMAFGIFVIATDPFAFLARKREGEVRR